MQANESYVLHVDRNAGTYVLTRNLRLIGPDPSNFRACENYTDLTRRTNFSLSLTLLIYPPSPLPHSPFSHSLSLAFPLLIPHGGSDAKSCSRHRLPCTEMSIPRRADVNSTKSLLSRGRNRVSRFYSIFVRCGKTRNHVVARSTIGSFRLV